MRVLFIVDPLPGLKAWKDTSVAMMRAMSARGYQLYFATMQDLFIDHGKVKASATAMSLVDQPDLSGHSWWHQDPQSTDQDLAGFDAVIMRKDPPFDLEYLYATHMFDFAAKQGARIFNSGSALRNHPEKLAITEFPEYTTPSLVSRDINRLRQFHAQHHDIIVKPLDGMGGSGIFRIQEHDPNIGVILETLTGFGTTSIMAQCYIPAIKQGDKRILIIGGEPIPYALARMPLEGETRGNLAAGGTGVAQELTAHDRAVAQAVGQRLSGRGLLLIGLDMIGDYITEINVTSPTCFVEITEQTGFNVADCFVDALEQQLKT